MKEITRFRILIISASFLTAFVISYNILHEDFFGDLEGHLRRRMYYERVISKKGLSEHKAMYWQNKD